MTGYIYLNKEKEQKHFFKKIFLEKLENGGIKIQVELNNKLNDEKKKKIAKKVVKKLKSKKIEKVVLENKIYNNFEILKENIQKNDISIITGDILYEEKLNEIIEYIFTYLKSLKMEEINLGIMINTLSYSRLKFIKEIANQVKGITILTDFITKFDDISENLMEETGLSLKVSNNYKNGLKGTNLIVNFDFDIENNNNVIYNNCILINLKDKIKKTRSGFNGIIINDINLEIDERLFEGLNIQNFRNLALLESIKNENNKITKIVGIRGIIDTKELQNFKIIKRKK